MAAAKVVDASWDIVLVNTSTGEERVAASGPASQFGPAWSPDGTHLAYFEADAPGRVRAGGPRRPAATVELL